MPLREDEVQEVLALALKVAKEEIALVLKAAAPAPIKFEAVPVKKEEKKNA